MGKPAPKKAPKRKVEKLLNLARRNKKVWNTIVKARKDIIRDALDNNRTFRTAARKAKLIPE
jgi:hypothetical protein